jgi:hypothetical protein
VLTPNQALWIKFQVFTGSPIHPPPLGALKVTFSVLPLEHVSEQRLLLDHVDVVVRPHHP